MAGLEHDLNMLALEGADEEVSADEEDRPRVPGGILLLSNPRSMKMSRDDGTSMRITDFDRIYLLGTGTFANVYLLRPKDKPTQVFAVKMISKSRIITHRQIEHMLSERHILSCLDHPFIIYLHGTFHDSQHLFLFESFLNGGELWTHLHGVGRFTVSIARFFMSSIVLALRYLHERDIVYRDLKPENIVLNHRGYACLVDFGFSKYVGPENRTFTVCGTPEYLAPEIINNAGHGRPVDWWAAGVLLFEMIYGHPPFYDSFPMQIYEKILEAPLVFPPLGDSEPDWNTKDIITGLLQKDVDARLGCGKADTDAIIRHPFFGGVDWESILNQTVQAPITVEDEDFASVPVMAPDEAYPAVYVDPSDPIMPPEPVSQDDPFANF